MVMGSSRPIIRRRLSSCVDLLTQEIEAPASLANPAVARKLGRIRDELVDIDIGVIPWWRRLSLRFRAHISR